MSSLRLLSGFLLAAFAAALYGVGPWRSAHSAADAVPAKFDAAIVSRDWSSYPILRFGSVPDSVDVHIIDRPGEPFLGTGEASHGPVAACLANAVADATGVRIRELPLSPRRVKAAIGV